MSQSTDINCRDSEYCPPVREANSVVTKLPYSLPTTLILLIVFNVVEVGADDEDICKDQGWSVVIGENRGRSPPNGQAVTTKDLSVFRPQTEPCVC